MKNKLINTKRLKKVAAVSLIAVLGVSLLGGCGTKTEDQNAASTSSGDQEERVVNIAIQPSAAFLPFYIVREKGWLEEALEEYNVTVNWNDFESGPPINESLAAGSSDIGFLGDVPTVSPIAAGQENEITAIACEAPLSYSILVAADSDINSTADLKGKKIATVLGSTGHNLVSKALAQNGLSFEDIELINISAGDASAVLSSGEVDAVAIWEPNITRLVDNGTAKIIATGEDVDLLGVNSIIARSAYAKDNEDVIKVVAEQFARGAKEIDTLDDETIEKVAEDLSIEPDQVQKLSSKFNYTVKPSQEDIDSLNDTIAFLVSIDTLSEEFDIAPYFQTKYTEVK